MERGGGKMSASAGIEIHQGSELQEKSDQPPSVAVSLGSPGTVGGRRDDPGPSPSPTDHRPYLLVVGGVFVQNMRQTLQSPLRGR